VPTYKYSVEDCLIIKKYKFVKNTNTLCIEYVVTNNTKKMLKMEIKPCITRRGLFDVKRKSEMKFTSLITPTDVKVSLNILENINLFMKSQNLRYEKKETYISGVNYDFANSPKRVNTFVEDLFVPGKFEAIVRPGNTNTYAIYVATEDVNIKGYNSKDIEKDIIEEEKVKTNKIEETYHELKDLAINAYSFQYMDADNKRFVISESIPVEKNEKDYIKNIISSLEGNYLILRRYKECQKILEAMISKLNVKDKKLNNIDLCESNLLFIEALNRFIQESECDIKEVSNFYEYVKNKIYEYVKNEASEASMGTDSLLSVDSKKYIKINCLWYNALKIFVELSDRYKENSDYIYTISENVKKNIIRNFFNVESKVLKYEISEEPYPNFDMIYALSLSYPLVHDKISIQLVDTAFKELYTPLGMRKFSLNNDQYDGYVYPHLMVHFIKANLRQMGVTRATQKLAYNLVKDLLSEINKSTVGTVKEKYFEKTKTPYGYPVNALTNAEMIRLYDLLT